MKQILIVILMLSNIFLMATREEISIKSDEVELSFENVEIEELVFSEGEKVIVEFEKADDVKIEKSNDKILISSPTEKKINIWLPKSKSYFFKKDEAFIKFNFEQVIINTDEGEIVDFSNGKLTVIDKEDNTKVVIDSEGIHVEEDGEKIEITSEGLTVEKEDGDKVYTGFWGQLLGGVIKSVASTAINYAGENPEEIIKSIINENPSNKEIFEYDNDWDENDKKGIER
ncbi:MAG: hypothetical protein HQ534_10915 [Armatimonadetes bacterium]|nr:hypothetical protein [Armatimonadota bacterium]